MSQAKSSKSTSKTTSMPQNDSTSKNSQQQQSRPSSANPSWEGSSTLQSPEPPKEPEFLSMYLLTYNMNGHDLPNPQELAGLFEFDRLGELDLYAVAIQELSVRSLISFDGGTLRELQRLFLSRGYVELVQYRWLIIGLSIYVRKSKAARFRGLSVDNTITDLTMRKGGIVARVHYGSLSLVFIAAHLFAHEENYDKRLKDVAQIVSETNFEGCKVDSVRRRFPIFEQDFVFMFGDLNFRTDLPLDEVRRGFAMDSPGMTLAQIVKLTKKQVKKCVTYDQLNKAMKNDFFVSHFREETVNFAPTFKFQIGTHLYDYKRTPSYTDRILWRNRLWNDTPLKYFQKSREAIRLDLSHYTSLPHYTFSDHKPVRLVVRLSEAASTTKDHYSVAVRKELNRGGKGAKRTKLTLDCLPAHWQQWTGAAVEELSCVVPKPVFPMDQALLTLIPTAPTRFWQVVFEPIERWTLDRHQRVRFRVVDSRTGLIIRPDRQELFDQLLTNWDWIGLYREDCCALDHYITFAYPHFGDAVEEADDVVALFPFFFRNRSNSASSSSSSDSSISSSSSSSSYKSTTTATSNLSAEAEFDQLAQQRSDSSRNRRSVSVEAHLPSTKVNTANGQPGSRRASVAVTKSNTDLFWAVFDENYVISPGRHQLIYRAKSGDILGLSEPFDITMKSSQ